MNRVTKYKINFGVMFHLYVHVNINSDHTIIVTVLCASIQETYNVSTCENNLHKNRHRVLYECYGNYSKVTIL
jgi:hypothetical protein